MVELGLTNIEPWWIIDGDRLRNRFAGLRERYRERSLVPFAIRQDNDDVACWDTIVGNVAIVHDFTWRYMSSALSLMISTRGSGRP